jgi:uncharacterized DUF497 family protein
MPFRRLGDDSAMESMLVRYAYRCEYAYMSSPVCFRIGSLSFTWDASKYETNVRKHGITFEEAASTWLDAHAIESFDEEHADREERWLRIGMSLRGALLVTWSAERITRRSVVIRIIGARRTTTKERRLYEREKKKRDA